MSKLMLKEDDTLTVVTYGRNPGLMPDLYITVPQAGWGGVIKAPHTMEVMLNGPDILLDIAYTSLCHNHDETPEEAAKTARCAEHFEMEGGPLSADILAQFPDMVSYTVATIGGDVILDVIDEAVQPVPEKREGMTPRHQVA